MSSVADPVDLILHAARARRDHGDIMGEQALLEGGLADHPRAPRLHNALGLNALIRRDFKAAGASFSRAAEQDPGEVSLWLNLAKACREMHDEDSEEVALERALEADRLHVLAQLRMAELRERRHETAKAAQHWSAVVQLIGAMDERSPALDATLRRGQAFIADHNRQFADALDMATDARLVEMGSAARRFRACVDHSLGRRKIYANQCEGIHFPFLPADEFFERSHFPWFEQLEARTDAIRTEALRLMAGTHDGIRPYVRLDAGAPENKWTALDHSFDWSACFLWEYGVRNDAMCALCPETAAALEAVPQTILPGKAPTAFFSILKPGAHIPPHTGVTNTRAIVHLPLVVPSGCRFRVGGETREWHEGEAFAFDDTIEHEAWNDGPDPRIVLILDVWNPHLTQDECDLLQTFFSVTDGFQR